MLILARFLSAHPSFAKKVAARHPVDRIIAEVAKAANVKVDDLQDRKTKLKNLRKMAMELSCRYSNDKQKEIGLNFGAGYSTVSQNQARLKTKLKF